MPKRFTYIGAIDTCFKRFSGQQMTSGEARQFCRSLGSGVDLLVTETDLKFQVLTEGVTNEGSYESEVGEEIIRSLRVDTEKVKSTLTLTLYIMANQL